MRGVDLLISLPPVLLGLLILAVTPPSLWKTIVAVGLVYIPIMVRLSRSVALGLLQEDYVQAARARGEGAAVDPVARDPAERVAGDHRRERAAGDVRDPARLRTVVPRPGAAAAGQRMGADDRARAGEFLDQAPWIGLAPGLCLCVLLVTVNLVGEGLRERLDPRAGPGACLRRCCSLGGARSVAFPTGARRLVQRARSRVARRAARRARWGWWGVRVGQVDLRAGVARAARRRAQVAARRMRVRRADLLRRRRRRLRGRRIGDGVPGPVLGAQPGADHRARR